MSGSSWNLSIQDEIEDVFDACPVDIRTINTALLTVQGRILKQGVLIYQRDKDGRVAFEVATRKLYFDFAPVAHRLRDAFLERLHKKGLLDG